MYSNTNQTFFFLTRKQYPTKRRMDKAKRTPYMMLILPVLLLAAEAFAASAVQNAKYRESTVMQENAANMRAAG
jgi:hypothetical protein